MPKKYHNVAIEEYTSLMAEISTIIESRYTVLTANIALVAVVIGLVFTQSQPSLYRWLPLVFFSVLFPSLLMNHYMTMHFTRLVSYLYVRFEDGSNKYVFQRALVIFKKKDKAYKAYTWPILLTYFLLTFFSLTVTLFVNWEILFGFTTSAGWLWSQIIFTSSAIFLAIRKTLVSRKSDAEFHAQWRDALIELGVYKRTR